MTRSKELRRIEAAIEHRNEAERLWALNDCEIRKRFGATGARRHHLEKRIRDALKEIEQAKG